MALLHQLECESACFFRDRQWALEAFGRAAAEGLIDVSWVRKCPLLDVIREDPGYPVITELVEKRAARIVQIMTER
jgi:serine/threonine-protein kinase